MAHQLFMLRTPGRKAFPALAHLLEGRVADNVSKEDAKRLLDAGIAEEFDPANEMHVRSVEEFDHLDARKGVPVAKAVTAPPKPSEAKKDEGKK